MLALIGNLDVLEILVIVAVAIIVFGKRLPEVSMRGAAHLMKLRREVVRMWRDAGLEDELRKVRREIETQVPRNLPTPEQLIRQAEHGLDRALEPDADAGSGSRESGSPEDVGAVGPIDPLTREALDQEPGQDSGLDSGLASDQEGDAGPGQEDAMYEASLQPRTEPDGDSSEEPAEEPAEEGDAADPDPDAAAGDPGTEKESA